jgi:heat shock protein HslJ
MIIMNKFFALSLLFTIGLSGCAYREMFQPTPEPVETMYVGPQRLPCENPYRNNECLQIRQSFDAEWELYKGNITGLQYEPGYNYQLEVQKDKSSKPDVDAPEIQWVLYRLVSKSKIGEATTVPIILQGITWNLAQLGNPAALTDARGEPRPSIFFQSDGHISGSTGCNRFNGTFSVDNDRMQIGSLAATKKMCPTPDAALLEQEQLIMQILQVADHFVLEPDRLQIISSGNSKVMVFTK